MPAPLPTTPTLPSSVSGVAKIDYHQQSTSGRNAAGKEQGGHISGLEKRTFRETPLVFLLRPDDWMVHGNLKGGLMAFCCSFGRSIGGLVGRLIGR